MTPLEKIACRHDGATLTGELACPAGPGPHPAVMVMHNALGLGDHMREVAGRLAAQGYVALATDMYGTDIDPSDPMAAGAYYDHLKKVPEKLRDRMRAWLDLLSAMPDVDADRIAAIGYCFGGYCVLELVRSGADVKAIVSYHGILDTRLPAQPGAVKGEVAVYTGAKDPFAPREHVEALREELSAAGAHFQITVFSEAEHSFTDPDAGAMNRAGIGYNALADRMSWAGTLALLEATLKT